MRRANASTLRYSRTHRGIRMIRNDFGRLFMYLNLFTHALIVIFFIQNAAAANAVLAQENEAPPPPLLKHTLHPPFIMQPPVFADALTVSRRPNNANYSKNSKRAKPNVQARFL